jgi:pimeloyl-ACP methyl ester carboxylesterase
MNGFYWVSQSGSFRATQYAVTFPERADRFVLDSVAPHGRMNSIMFGFRKIS